MTLAAPFTPDERYDGVRPIQVLAMRIGYMLVFVLVIPEDAADLQLPPVVIPLVLIPWGYVHRTYIRNWPRPDVARQITFSELCP